MVKGTLQLWPRQEDIEEPVPQYNIMYGIVKKYYAE